MTVVPESLTEFILEHSELIPEFNAFCEAKEKEMSHNVIFLRFYESKGLGEEFKLIMKQAGMEE